MTRRRMFIRPISRTHAHEFAGIGWPLKRMHAASRWNDVAIIAIALILLF